jgi:hypothetical protein
VGPVLALGPLPRVFGALRMRRRGRQNRFASLTQPFRDSLLLVAFTLRRPRRARPSGARSVREMGGGELGGGPASEAKLRREGVGAADQATPFATCAQ